MADNQSKKSIPENMANLSKRLELRSQKPSTASSRRLRKEIRSKSSNEPRRITEERGSNEVEAGTIVLDTVEFRRRFGGEGDEVEEEVEEEEVETSSGDDHVSDSDYSGDLDSYRVEPRDMSSLDEGKEDVDLMEAYNEVGLVEGAGNELALVLVDTEVTSVEGNKGVASVEVNKEVDLGKDDFVDVEIQSDARQVAIGRDSSGKLKGIVSQAQAESAASTFAGRKRKAPADDWIIKGSVEGGPEIPDVIPSFGGHRAYKLYTDPKADGGLLSGQNRYSGVCNLSEWKLMDESKRLIKASGLSQLTDVVLEYLDMPLLTAFIERWQPDTNTFMMPWGEMSIYLHDVQEILRVQVTGKQCTISEDLLEHPVRAISDFFGGADASDLKRPFDDRHKAPTLLGRGVLVSAIEVEH